MHHVKFIFGIPLLLCGCTVGPNYRAPQTSIERYFGRGSRSGASQPSVVTLSPVTVARWWQTLHDPLLDKLIERTVVSNLDVKIAQARVRQARAELAYRIAILAGQQPEALTDELMPPQPVPVPPPEIAIGVPAELLRRRPDIRRAERDLAAATARIGQATADLYPKLSLTGSFAMLSADTKSLFDWRSRNFGIGPTITWPIFDAGRLRSVIDIRTADEERAMAQYDRTVLGALEEVHNALVAFATEQERHLALVDAVTADQTSADIALGQYRRGVIDFLNVLETQRSLFESQDQLADSDRLVTTSLIALYKALGGGWEAASSSTTNDQYSRSPEVKAQTH